METYFEFEGFTDDLLLTEEKSPFAAAVIAAAVGQVAGAVGNVAQASAKKKDAQARLAEIGGKRQAQMKACEDNKAFKKFLDRKYRRNRINDCQKEVKERLAAEEEEQKEIVRRMTAIEESKILADREKAKSQEKSALTEIEEKKSSKKLYVYGGIAGLVLILGTVLLLKK